ncbi:O-antigen ligase family protein [Vibrio cholerae]|uniref:O-antigen ligase family protein n=1 Tax=Vibrio cholerae TaxID=666 RepID=UPI0011EC66E8|nr:O-antigen ligase family protein [Vibrio cholerae]TYW36107.1 hypothetical protein FY548_09830 [Vibrio cholerae]
MINNMIFLKKIIFIAMSFFMVIYFSYFSSNLNLIALLFPFSLIMIAFLLFHPKILGCLFILSTVEFVGFINPEEFIRLPGVFKFRDLLFLMMMTMVIADSLLKGWYRIKLDYFSVRIKFIVWSMLGLVFFQLIFTSLRFDLPFISSLKIAREFLYVAVFFFFIRFFPDYKDTIRLLKFISYICVIQFVSMIMQIVGFDIGSTSRVDQLLVGGDYVTRVYIPAYFYALAAACYCFVSLMVGNVASKRYVTFVLIISILSYTRTYWVSLLVCFLILMFLLNKKNAIRMLLYGLILFILLIPISLVKEDSVLADRFSTIFSEIDDTDGNFIYRFSENPQRLEAFIDYPIVGPGFIHPDFAPTTLGFVIDEKGKNEAQIERALMLQTNDSGLITLLVSFGLIGVLWVFAQILLVIKLAKSIKNRANEILYPYIGIVAFMVATWLTCTTTYGFTYYDGIVSMSIALYFLFSASKLMQKANNQA